jgi:hypothetical protein
MIYDYRQRNEERVALWPEVKGVAFMVISLIAWAELAFFLVLHYYVR